MTIAYITRYALSTGIYKAAGRYDGSVFTQTRSGNGAFDQSFHGNDFWFSEDEAIRRAEEMRIKKLQSLDKQMKKISAMKFEIK